MANFQPKEININNINGGKRFEFNDGISAEAINAPIEASAYSQYVANVGYQKASQALEKSKELEGQVNGSGKTFPNANILDNWYFINPINQLEIVNFPQLNYGIDRWIGTSGVYVTSNGLYFEASDNFIVQRFEDDVKSFLNGKTLTVSLITGNGKVHYSTFVYQSAPSAQYTVLYSDEFHSAITTEGGLLFYSVIPNTLVAVKLEIGATQTLAYESGGVWNMNDPIPNRATELLKCQRYLIVYKGYSFMGSGMATIDSATNKSLVQFSFPLPTNMRLKNVPIRSNGAIGFFTGKQNYYAEAISESASLNVAVAKADITLPNAIESYGTVWLENNIWLTLDANL